VLLYTVPCREGVRGSACRRICIPRAAIRRAKCSIGFQPVSSVDNGWFTFWFEDDGSGSPDTKSEAGPNCRPLRAVAAEYSTARLITSDECG
jgi:hypothetical protein